ncbi:putative Insulin-degrading enzyme [Zostera marina]|uniref:Putative Insulin-degrading enzyme n=1 Tax=Zostera marina TaxID=29655 RepID=A0A0K9P6C7_ZOSMR|nr:putative Insulin-degrading enzyme [Zostera marina]
MKRMEVEIVKPRTDKREYRRIVLPNSLEALLISDPETDKAAASMDVSVGTFSNPEGLEGLAHFLEHMLFYASEKYPIEDSYSKYIAEHGGSTNAYTSSEHTNYYFDINADCLEEALDRFAQFFIKPLMSADATLREIKAVDSENQKNLLSDSWRIHQLQKHISKEDHPFHKFGTGNWDTLEVLPKAKGLDTREELIKFYKDHYSANLMHLVVYGKGSLDEIQSTVEEKFTSVPNTEQKYFCAPGQPCAPQHVQILVKAVPIKQGHSLRVSWPISPSIKNYKSGPCRYLSHLIGHEGNGSLYFILKALGWVIDLSAGEEDSSDDFSFFSVRINLTDTGYAHVEDIVGLLFKYISLLQNSGIHEWIFDELKAISDIGFHYKDKNQPISYVSSISANMQYYPPEDWLVASSLPSKFEPSTIETVLNALTPANVRIFWISRKFDGCTNSVEPWYRTAYSVEKVEAPSIQQWIESAPDAKLHLPNPNVFIPTDLTIKNMAAKVKLPKLIRESLYSCLWYKPDSTFFTPKAYIRMDFNCPHSNQSPEASVLTEIFTRLLMDYLNEYAYDAQVAGLYYWISNKTTGFQVNVSGFNHKMGILVEKVIDSIAEFEVKIDRFSVIKESMSKEYENIKFQQPYQQAMYWGSLLLKDQIWPWSEEGEVLSHLEANDLAMFVPHLLSRAFVECYITGNMEPEESESLVQNIESVLFQSSPPICKALFPSQYLTNRIVKLEKGISYHYPVEVLNQSDENSALVNYIQIHRDDIKMNVKLDLFALLAKQPAFHQLRSVEQLGYITALIQRDDHGIRGLALVIQSTAKDPSELNSRAEAFLEMYEKELREMDIENYKSNVNALIDMKLEKHKNLWEECAFYWNEIVSGTLNFNRRDLEIAALRELKHHELVDFFDRYVKVGSPERKSVSFQVFGGLHSAEYKIAKNGSGRHPNKMNRIDDIIMFKKSRPLYGSLKGGFTQTKL